MKLSQLLKVIDKNDKIIVNAYGQSPLNNSIYEGQVRGIKKENPINKRHVKFVMAFDDKIVIEVSENEQMRM